MGKAVDWILGVVLVVALYLAVCAVLLVLSMGLTAMSEGVERAHPKKDVQEVLRARGCG